LIMDTETIDICTACHDGSGADCDVVLGNYVQNGSWISHWDVALADSRPAAQVLTEDEAAGAGATLQVTDATGYNVGEQVATGDPDAAPAGFELSTITAVSTVTDIITIDNLTTALQIGDIVGNYTESANDHANWGTVGDELMGGGFDGVTGTSTTSAHITDIGNGDTKWGIQFGENASMADADSATLQITCVSCHLPHRSKNYRMLRQTPQGLNNEVAALDVMDNFSRGSDGGITESHAYTENTGKFNVVRVGDVRGGITSEGVSAWCGACHDYYYDNANLDDADDAPTAGDGMDDAPSYYSASAAYMHAVDVDLVYTPRNGSTGGTALTLWDNLDVGTFADRLPVAEDETVGTAGDYDSTDEISCLTCHRAHGTEAAMAGNARIGVKNRLGMTTEGKGAAEDLSDSVLLRIPNRGVCETCHDMPIGY
jgi:hypothetical protein